MHKFLDELKNKVDEDPTKSFTQLAEEMGIKSTIINIAINEDLRYTSYRRPNPHREGQGEMPDQGQEAVQQAQEAPGAEHALVLF